MPRQRSQGSVTLAAHGWEMGHTGRAAGPSTPSRARGAEVRASRPLSRPAALARRQRRRGLRVEAEAATPGTLGQAPTGPRRGLPQACAPAGRCAGRVAHTPASFPFPSPQTSKTREGEEGKGGGTESASRRGEGHSRRPVAAQAAPDGHACWPIASASSPPPRLGASCAVGGRWRGVTRSRRRQGCVRGNGAQSIFRVRRRRQAPSPHPLASPSR